MLSTQVVSTRAEACLVDLPQPRVCVALDGLCHCRAAPPVARERVRGSGHGCGAGCTLQDGGLAARRVAGVWLGSGVQGPLIIYRCLLRFALLRCCARAVLCVDASCRSGAHHCRHRRARFWRWWPWAAADGGGRGVGVWCVSGWGACPSARMRGEPWPFEASCQFAFALRP